MLTFFIIRAEGGRDYLLMYNFRVTGDATAILDLSLQ